VKPVRVESMNGRKTSIVMKMTTIFGTNESVIS
jgi:hypothetical protein